MNLELTRLFHVGFTRMCSFGRELSRSGADWCRSGVIWVERQLFYRDLYYFQLHFLFMNLGKCS